MARPGGLGRLPASDARDTRFRIAPLLAAVPIERDFRYWWPGGWSGDQGNTPQCVGFAWTHWLEDGPRTRPAPGPEVDPAGVYRDAQLIDEWPGEDYDGTSVRAGAKVLEARGFIREYRWAWDLDTLVRAVLTTSPVVVGTNWYYGMDTPDAEGRLRLTGGVAGGHAYEISGVNRRRARARMKNSWGPEWGNNGSAWIAFEDLERLILEDGEVCLAVEV